MLAEALAYAARGWPVFPCNPETKRPLVGKDRDKDGKEIPNTGGVKKATTDEAQIREWWGRWPLALIGVAMGGRAGVWVIDFDPRDGETVDEVEARFIAEVGALPAGPQSRTQSGGKHVWLTMPEGEEPRNSVKRLKNIDWRAEGGYVIAPPSVMKSGTKYEWIISPDFIGFPKPTEAILDLVMRRGKWAPQQTPKAVARAGYVPSNDKIRRYCTLALQKASARVAAAIEGTWNNTLNNEALNIGHLVGTGGITYDEAYESLRDAAYAWGIGNDDKALVPGGTLERALHDGMREPKDLSHVGTLTRPEREPEPEPEYVPGRDYDADTGEFPPDDPEPPVSEHVGPSGDEPDSVVPTLMGLPFRALGFNRGTYFYLAHGTLQITPLKAAQHSPLQLLQLANLNEWREFLSIGNGKITAEQWIQIADILMKACHRNGIFSEKRVRGRGAWVDGRKVIVHMGDMVRIDGDPVPLTDVPGRAIYEAEEPWDFEFGSPASNSEAHALVDICQRLTWQEKMSGALFAGWNVIAPVCGALKWRPHIWITGPSKSGKTTAVTEIAGRIVGPAAVRFEGNTTEAGIRQKMQFDALPIILDEAESEDAAAVIRMQGVLGLARLASSGGTVAKGTTGGRAMEFVARSSFLFASINTALKHHADESRVTRLTLSKNGAPDALKHYQDLIRDIDATFTREYAGAMFSRTVANLHTLLKNIETFKSAAAAQFRDRRAADQIGPMLAGFYLCHSTKAISLGEAQDFISKHDWTDHASLDSASDEKRLLTYLMSKRIRFTVQGSPREMTVGQAIYECRDENTGRFYAEALGARGIKVDFDTFTVSNSAPGIAELLRDTQWVSDWKRPLAQIDGAEKTRSSVYFSPGIITRGVILATAILMEG